MNSGGKFKVPSLRVVSMTAPYFHDGYAALEQTEQDVRDIVEFLKTSDRLGALRSCWGS